MTLEPSNPKLKAKTLATIAGVPVLCSVPEHDAGAVVGVAADAGGGVAGFYGRHRQQAHKRTDHILHRRLRARGAVAARGAGGATVEGDTAFSDVPPAVCAPDARTADETPDSH